MSGVDQSVFEFARNTTRARSFRELFEHTQAEVERVLGYRTIWFAIKDSEQSEHVRIVDFVGAQGDLLSDKINTVPVAGDAMLEEIFEGRGIVVVEDARSDPRTNKQIVEALQNRTIVNVPLAILDKPFGALGMGTFGDEEGCRAPTPAMLQHLTLVASLLSVATARLRLEEHTKRAARERQEMERRLARMQRLDTVGVLAGGVAHDFNNLLTVVAAASSLARRAQSADEIQRELDAIEEVVDRGQALTSQLLSMSRAQPPRLDDVDLGVQLDHLVPLLRRVIPESVRIELINTAHLVFVEADRTQLDQVMMNLCLNARDAMEQGGRLAIETEVVLVDGSYRETHPWAREGRYVMISVSDTGRGIPKEHLDRIFDPFFTTRADKTGTGLGLSVVHGIVRQHQGMVHCYSEVGLGTTFKIYLPLLARAARLVGSKIPPRVEGGRERILVGEDDVGVRSVVRRLLQRAGYEVALVPDGEEVVRTLLADQAFDLLVLDVVMPGPPCDQTIARVREISPNLRILLASGYTADINVATLLTERDVPLLRKPYDPDALLRAIRGELDRR
jgi:signal transduction histidine kinase